MKAPPERIYPHIANLHAWGPWSPWEKKDPAMKRTFSGPDSGVGAAYGWEGDKNVGTGKMTILEATAPGLDEAKFQELAKGAKQNCPLSKALAAVPEITLDARLRAA